MTRTKNDPKQKTKQRLEAIATATAAHYCDKSSLRIEGRKTILQFEVATIDSELLQLQSEIMVLKQQRAENVATIQALDQLLESRG